MNYDLGERDRNIMILLAERGIVNVSELAEKFQVSEVTIRTDLRGLEERGLVARTRGGAVPTLHRDILERQAQRVDEKARIARAAAELVEDGDVIMIEAGTTTAQVVRFLGGKRDVHLVTNSMLAFNFSRANPALQVTMTGGDFRRSTESFVGPLALRVIERMNVKWAFVGTDGFSAEKGMTTHLVEAAEIVMAMKKNAERTVLVADASKYGRIGFASMLSLQEVDMVITDKSLSQEARDELAAADVKLDIV